MSVNLVNLAAVQYANSIQLLLQQKGSVLKPIVSVGNHVGKSANVVDQIAKIEMSPVVGRFAPMARNDFQVDKRWIFPLDFDLPQQIDSFDKLRLLNDPNNAVVQGAVYASGRQIDTLISTAFFATAYTGANGSTATTLPAANVVAVNEGAATNTGLTVAKLRKAKRLLLGYFVDTMSDPIYCVATARQLDDLLSEITVTSNDFNTNGGVPALENGMITRFLGVNFIQYEGLPVDGSSYRRVAMFAKSGIYCGFWNDISTSISKRNDLQGEPFQAYVYMTAGATRLEENKVIEIKCSEA